MHGFFLAVLIVLATCGSANALSGKVVGVTDGDTIVVLTTDRVRKKVRLASIDAPERRQAFGKVAKKRLSELVLKRDVYVTDDTIDKYGRTVGLVTVGGLNVNEAMIRDGLAWVYTRYLNVPRDSSFVLSEDYAKKNRRGLWVDDSPIAPWEFRDLRND